MLVHRKLSSFRRDSKLSTWIYRVAVNAAIRARRRWAPRLPEPGTIRLRDGAWIEPLVRGRGGREEAARRLPRSCGPSCCSGRWDSGTTRSPGFSAARGAPWSSGSTGPWKPCGRSGKDVEESLEVRQSMSACLNERLIKPWLDGELEPSAASASRPTWGTAPPAGRPRGLPRDLRRGIPLALEPAPSRTPRPSSRAPSAMRETRAASSHHEARGAAGRVGPHRGPGCPLHAIPQPGLGRGQRRDELIAVALSEPEPEEDF